MGYFVPEVLGVGYNHVEKVLNGDIVLKVVVLLAVLALCLDEARKERPDRQPSDIARMLERL